MDASASLPIQELAADIRQARVAAMTLREAAQVTGFSPSYLCDIEHARRLPPPETIKRLAQVIRVSPDRWLWLWLRTQMSEDDILGAVSAKDPIPSAWRQGPVHCLSCGARQISVRPENTTALECGRCGEMACFEKGGE
jgi:transcriptional regulator with XRE-family HTH domain